MRENCEYGVTVTVWCVCGEEIACQFFNIASDRSVDVTTAYRCEKCHIEAAEDGYERGYRSGEIAGYDKGSQEAYDEGYEAGCESNIKFVPDDELAEDY